MSPIESCLWNYISKSYLNTYDQYIEYSASNLQDWLDSCEAARQLFDDGLIEDVSDFVFVTSGPVPTTELPDIEFSLTETAVHKIESERKPQS